MVKRSSVFAHLALAIGIGMASAGVASASQDETPLAVASPKPEPAPLVSIPAAPFSRISEGGEPIMPVFRDYFRLPNAEQVRIEQRVTVRISPRPAPMPLAVMSSSNDMIREESRIRTIERKMGKCVPLTSVLGVQSGGGNKLVLFLRGQRLVSATLEKACQGRDYYSGFLVAQHADGQLCADRDELLARSGAKCKVQGYREIMLVED